MGCRRQAGSEGSVERGLKEAVEQRHELMNQTG
jgi:hypothetical protein